MNKPTGKQAFINLTQFLINLLFQQDDDEPVAAKKVQTEFTVKLVKFDDKQKVALIKECKNLLEGMNLVQVIVEYSGTWSIR